MARYKKTTCVPRPHRQDIRRAQEAGTLIMSSVLIERLPDSTSVKYRETVPAEDSYYLIRLELENASWVKAQKVKAKRYEEAQRLVDEALLRETNEKSNDSTNKVSLLGFRSEIDEKQGKWRDALLHSDEVHLAG